MNELPPDLAASVGEFTDWLDSCQERFSKELMATTGIEPPALDSAEAVKMAAPVIAKLQSESGRAYVSFYVEAIAVCLSGLRSAANHWLLSVESVGDSRHVHDQNVAQMESWERRILAMSHGFELMIAEWASAGPDDGANA